jgi:hypothetical protein
VAVPDTDTDVAGPVAARLVHGLLTRLSDRDRAGVLAALSDTERPLVDRVAAHGQRLAAPPAGEPTPWPRPIRRTVTAPSGRAMVLDAVMASRPGP